MRTLALLFLLAAGVAPRLHAQASVAVGVGGEVTGALGSKISVPVFADMRVSGGHLLGSYTLRVQWTSTTALSYAWVEAGAFGQPTVQDDSAFAGVIYVAGLNAAGQSSVVDLFRIVFTVGSGTSANINLRVDELSAANTFTNLKTALTVNVVNGAFCASNGRWGDLNNDGSADALDALAILSNVVGMTVPAGFSMVRADVNGDGNGNSVDALIVLSFAVGLEIPGQRVLMPVPGGCASGTVPTLKVFPDTVDVVRGQRVFLKLQARSATGTLVTFAANWEIADPGIAVVETSGRITGRGVGTTRVTAALGPGIRFTVPVVVRDRRTVWHVNAPLAKQSPIQLGTVKYPLATPQRAFPHVREGDTIRVAPGVHDYEDPAQDEEYGLDFSDEVRAGIVVIGDTLANGTRPVLRAPYDYYASAFEWSDTYYDPYYYYYYGTPRAASPAAPQALARRAEIRDIVLEGFYYGFYLENLQSLTVRNVRVSESAASYGTGIYVSNSVDTLRVIKSDFVADTGYSSSYGIYVNNGARLIVVDSSTFQYWEDGGIYLYDVDSLDVQRSVFDRTDYYGIRSQASYRPSVAVRVSRSRFIDNYYDAIYVDDARIVALDHNYIFAKRDDGVTVYGASPVLNGSRLVMKGDSIRMRTSSYGWLYATQLDSVLAESLWVETGAADTALYSYNTVNARYARFRKSRFLNLYYEGIDFSGRRLVVDSSEFRGCSTGCSWVNAYAIQARAGTDSGPSVTVNKSTFFNVYLGLYVPNSGDSSGPVVFTGNDLDSVGYGVQARADSQVYADNVLNRVASYGIYTEPSYSANRPFVSAVLERNRITCHPNQSATGITVYYTPAVIRNNAVRNCYTGIYANNGSSYPLANLKVLGDTVISDSSHYYTSGIYVSGKWRLTASGNLVRRHYNGMYLSASDTASARVDSNSVFEAFYGIYLAFGDVAVTGLRNNVQNNSYGILNNYHVSGSRSFTGGIIAGNTSAGLQNGASITFGAQGNWWGASTAPGTNGPNSGTIDTSGTLLSAPSDVPGPPPSAAAPFGTVAAAPVAAPAVAGPAMAPQPATGTDPVLEAARRNSAESSKDGARVSRQGERDDARARAERWRADRKTGAR